ncbi:class I SAM-dependent methyltransferase [Desulfosporosinus sp. BICA1-9]|uniref:class I SAM-dependent methyltransferase n=1 Tax=Desulfosporosinus sp. BICA1-9 TaxID=1531958 RepID=UPI00054AFD94|nr:class I SAM-dependent methyltransferase [Desulfosporosinus sp. BICA1-9]KJS48607.1 MAG: ubiquinone biosynthesis methyltransferase UbiE [Peptococcaceae bacterium BRH_c23]KJS49099.1 MAG: ubiquinone biosynthesis methyltransferase UbiE [Peptococcaceae bacterium BRH_c23]KJS81506.1 MAG: ubiquinone biosynthesis methyltransferase UbiE [Desulfosporosinus sp. BICA1-9]HBW35219.1 class I SAM-dependent methyltransferase [Desulfosporosinus sp.]
MEELLEKVEQYWDKRSDGYCQINLEELDSYKRDAWTDLINEYAPKVSGRKLKVLDIGTGPGFFAILMASCGYEVSAVDYTEAMLKKAKNNASNYKNSITFRRMDAHKLDFEDNTFDLIVTRNLTWNLEKPDQAYREWYRVLARGGKLLNFDANWYLYLHDAQKRKEYEQDRLNSKVRGMKDHYTSTNTKVMEEIARNLPLSKEHRPEWDTKELLTIGFKKIMLEVEIGNRVWDEEEKVNYGSTPMFMIGAEK